MARGKSEGDKYNLNLVPFIDLFSTLIIFLLSTAVWDQLAAVPITLGNSEQSKVSMPSKDEARLVKSDIKVLINKDTVEIIEMGRPTRYDRETLVSSQYEAIGLFASEARGKYPDKHDVVLQVSDNAPYEDLVNVMDQFLENDFDQLIVMGAEL